MKTFSTAEFLCCPYYKKIRGSLNHKNLNRRKNLKAVKHWNQYTLDKSNQGASYTDSTYIEQ